MPTKRQLPQQSGNAPTEVLLARLAEYVLDKSNDSHVIIGPLVWHRDGDRPNMRYFIVETSEEGRGWRGDKIEVPKDEAVELRTQFIAALVRQRPLVLHDMDDELAAAKLAATLWPGPRIKRIVREIEEERRLDRMPH
jgi:hypothetical protein